MNTNNCKGCLLYETDSVGCITRNSPNIINCPCNNCIIKMLCKTGCQEYKDCEKESITYENK